MKQMTWLLRHAARLLPPERRPWAEALQAEADQVPVGWPRLRWLAGGLVLVAREAHMARKIVYRLGLGAVVTAAAWAVILSWQQTQAADVESMTDRARILAGAAALLLLPWLGRRRGVFGPVGDNVAARLVRVAGCGAICYVGMVFVRIDSHSNVNDAIGTGTFSWLREIAGVVLIAALFVVPGMVRARWPRLDPVGLWILTALAGVPVLILAPFQLIAVLLVAGVYVLTSRRSRVMPATLTAGALAGLAGGGLDVGTHEYHPAPARFLDRRLVPDAVHGAPARRPGRPGGGLAAVGHRQPAGAAEGAHPAGAHRGRDGRFGQRDGAHVHHGVVPYADPGAGVRPGRERHRRRLGG